MSLGINNNILNQKGTPAFYSDVFANRPAFGYAGRVFISTDTGAIYEDTGSAWTLIADAGAGTTGTLQQVTTNGKTTDQGITVTAGDISTNKLNITGTAGTNGLLSLVQNSAVLSGVTDKTTLYGLGNTSIYMNINTFGNNYAARFNFGLVDPNVTAKILYIPNGDGVLSLSNTGLTGYNTIPNTSFANSQFYSGLISPLESHVYKIGVTGTAQANSSDANQWGVGVYGAGYTNGATRAAGVKGDGEVTNSADTGSAIGVRGYATATHAGGLNIGILAEASGSGTGNYGLYTNMASAANTYANYHLGTAISYFGGSVGIGVTPTEILDIFGSSSTGVKIKIKNNTDGLDNVKYAGIDFVAGSDNGTSAIRSYRTNSGSNFETALAFLTNPSGGTTTPTEKVRISSSGNLGINTTNPASKITILEASDTLTNGIRIYRSNNADFFETYMSGGFGGLSDTYNFYASFTGGIVAAIDRSGKGYFANNLLVGTSTDPNSGVIVGSQSAANWTIYSRSTAASGAVYGFLAEFTAQSPNNTSTYFYNASDTTTQRFSVRGNGGIYNFQANNSNLSDIRTKKDIIPLESYWNKFKDIEIVKYKYIDQDHDDYNIGVIAQQVEAVAPEFVDTDFWDNPKNNNKIELKSIFTTDLYHATIKVLQECMTKIEELNEKLQRNNIN